MRTATPDHIGTNLINFIEKTSPRARPTTTKNSNQLIFVAKTAIPVPKWRKYYFNSGPVCFPCWISFISTWLGMKGSRRSSMSHWSTGLKLKLPNLIRIWINTPISTRSKIAFLTLSSRVNSSCAVSLSSKKSSASPSTLSSPSTNKSPKNQSLKKSMAKPPCVSSNMYPHNLKSKNKAQSNKPTKSPIKSSHNKSWKCPKTSSPPQPPKMIETNSFTATLDLFSPRVNTKKITSLIFGSCLTPSTAH